MVAHEYAHAITHNFTGLTIDNGVESAMNEGLSDIWGVIIENEVASEKDHWKIGEEVIDVAGDNCLRNIQDPESSTANVQMADTFGDATYTSGNFYAKSGVMSHWFYLLSEGGDGQNDNDDDYLVYGLGIDMAAEIVFEGQTGHFADVDNYTEARTAMVDAADDLFGENSFQSLQVENAWYAVGVGSEPTQVSISSSNPVCYSGSTFNTRNAPSGSSINWTVSSNLTIQSGGSTTTPSIRASTSSTSGAGWVQINFTSNGYTSAGPRKIVWVGKPTLNVGEYIFSNGIEEEGFLCTSHAGNEFDVSYVDDLCLCDNYEVKLTNIYNTQTIDQFYTSNGTGNLDYSNLSEGYYLFWARGHNDCGWGDWCETEIEFVDCSMMESIFYIDIFPNPTITETTIELKRYDKKEVAENIEWEFEVFDMGQNLKVKSNKIRGKRHKILSQDWKRGIYIVRAKINDKLITTKLVVDR